MLAYPGSSEPVIVSASAAGFTVALAVPTNPIGSDQINLDLLTTAATLTLNAAILPTTGLSLSVVGRDAGRHRARRRSSSASTPRSTPSSTARPPPRSAQAPRRAAALPELARRRHDDSAPTPAAAKAQAEQRAVRAHVRAGSRLRGYREPRWSAAESAVVFVSAVPHEDRGASTV